MFLVYVPQSTVGFLFTPFLDFFLPSTAEMTRIFMFDRAVALDRATYSWPWENTGSGKYTPTLGIVWPYALLTVIAKLSRTGNCFLLNWKREHLFIRGTQRYTRKENPFSNVLTQYNLCVNAISLEATNDQPGDIAKSICRVYIPEQYNRTSNLELQNMRWQPIRCQCV